MISLRNIRVTNVGHDAAATVDVALVVHKSHSVVIVARARCTLFIENSAYTHGHARKHTHSHTHEQYLCAQSLRHATLETRDKHSAAAHKPTHIPGTRLDARTAPHTTI